MCVPLLLLVFLDLRAARNRQGGVSSWGFALGRTAWLAAGLPLHTSFLPLEEQLLSLKKSNGSSKSDSPCKGAIVVGFLSLHKSEAWLQTGVVTAELCSSTGLRGNGHSRRGQLALSAWTCFHPLSPGDKEALLLQEHSRSFGKWFSVRSVGPRQ